MLLQFQKLKELRDEVMKKQTALDKLTSRYTRLLENKPDTVQQHISPVKVNTVHMLIADILGLQDVRCPILLIKFPFFLYFEEIPIFLEKNHTVLNSHFSW